MTDSLEVDGVDYHAKVKESSFGKETFTDDDYELILDENGNPIPLTFCLCFAYAPSECCCATTSWENYQEFDDDDSW